MTRRSPASPRRHAASRSSHRKDATVDQPGDDTLIERVRAALAREPRVEEKRMFGGTAFMVRGRICVSARPQRIMCRIDPAVHDDVLERPGCRTVVMKGRQYRGYVWVDASAVRRAPALESWIALALDYNARSQRSPRKTR